MIAYKVVCLIDGELQSTNSAVRVTYKLDKWTKPKMKHSRLFVFDTIENARYALNMLNGHSHKIYMCEARGVIPARYIRDENNEWVSDNYDRYSRRWKLFNKLIRQHKAAAIPMTIMNGTLFAKEVKLLGQVSNY
jgi:hypothetical protein